MASIVVKLGSSIVADHRGEARMDVLGPVCEEVAVRHAAGDSVVLVTSGAIARGMRLIDLPVRPAAMEELQAASAVGQGPLFRTYSDLLDQHGVPSAQVLLTFFDMSARTHYLNARRTLRKLLDWRVVPVINENDTTTTHAISFGANAILAAQMATAAGIPAVIARGDEQGALRAALAGEEAGTRFHPQVGKVSSFKLWLKYAKPSHGSIGVDEGAERALRERGTSLLPVGIVDVRGDFDVGDAVDVRAAGDGRRPIGKGIVNYSAEELRQVCGKKSDEVRELLPRAAPEAVHRDYFVLD